MNETVFQKNNVNNKNTGSKTLSVHVGLPEKLEFKTPLQDTGSCRNSFTASAWRNDSACTKLILSNRGDSILSARISAGVLVPETGSTITRENIRIRRMQNVNVNIGRNNPQAPLRSFPDILLPADCTDGAQLTADIQAHSSVLVWIDISVPEDTAPGCYRGALTVTVDNVDPAPIIVECTLHVIDLVQPAPAETGTLAELWQYPFAVAEYYGVKETEYFTNTHFNYLRDSLTAYRETGGTAVTATIVEEAWNHQSFYGNPSMIKWFRRPDGTFSFDYSWYDRWISYAVRLGILNPSAGIGAIQCYSIVPWENQIGYTDLASGRYRTQRFTPGTQEWNSLWKEFLTDFLNHSEEMGWLDLTYIAMDERKIEELIPAVDLIHSVRSSKSGKRFRIFSALNYNRQNDPSFTDRIDDISVALCHIDREGSLFRRFTAHRRTLGLKTTVYNCTGIYPGSFLYNDPAENEWMMWYTLAQGADGFLRWAWDNWTDDPLGGNSYSAFEPGDCWYVYPAARLAPDHSSPQNQPAERVTSGVYSLSSPRCEMLKKGIRDVAKAKYLMSRDAEMNKKINELLKTLRRPHECINEYGSAAPASEKDARILLEDTLRMHDCLMELSADYVQKRTAL